MFYSNELNINISRKPITILSDIWMCLHAFNLSAVKLSNHFFLQKIHTQNGFNVVKVLCFDIDFPLHHTVVLVLGSWFDSWSLYLGLGLGSCAIHCSPQICQLLLLRFLGTKISKISVYRRKTNFYKVS